MGWTFGCNHHQGRSHTKHGLECQDAALVERDGERVYAIVADGAGTSTYAREAASLAAETMKKFLLEGDVFQKGDSFLREGFFAVNNALQAFAEKIGAAEKDCMTTLLVGCFTPQKAFLGQVGDGFIVVKQKRETPLFLPLPQTKEYANETDLLPTSKIGLRTSIVGGGVHFFALSSDGLEAVAVDQKTKEPHAPFFEPFIDYLHGAPPEEEVKEELQTFLGSERLQTRVDDDVSLVVGLWL